MISFFKSRDRSIKRDELKKRLSDLQAEVSRYKRIFRGSRGYGFVDWDLNQNVMSWNGGYWQSLGYSDEEIQSLSNPQQFEQFLHPEDRDGLYAKSRSLLKGEDTAEIITRVLKKGKGHIWSAVRVEATRDSSGWVNHISGVAFDISKIKLTEQALLLSEARHERIIRSSRDGIWEWNADKNQFHYSNGCWRLLGYDETDDVIAKGRDKWLLWRSFIHEDDFQRVDQALVDHYKFNVPFDVEYRIRGKHDWVWIRARGQAEFDENQKLLRMSGTNMDNTKLKLAQSRVIQAKEQAEKANQAKSEFLSSMSHELRTPLNAILGFANLLSTDSSLSSDQQSGMREIIRAGNHLLQLINDVLDLARIEAGRMTVRRETIAPLAAVNECIELIRAQAEARGVSLDCESLQARNVWIQADPIRLKQVLLNLLSNAVKYNKRNGYVRITFVLNKVGDEDRLRINIIDSGKGIPEKYRTSVFRPFNRLGEEGSNIEGAGIGLVITKNLVEKMQGNIDFQSEPGRGSTFWLEFPRVDEGDMPVEPANTGEFADETTEVMLAFAHTVKILYVEDNLANQRLLQQVLARYTNINLVLSVEAMEGLFRARTEKPDLIILDIDLPGLSGYDLVTILKQDEQTSGIPVFALSAKVMSHDIAKGKACGFDQYLTKPFELDRFIRHCNALFVGAG